MAIKSAFFDKICVADMEKVHSAVIGWMFSDNCQALDKKQRSEILCELFGVKPFVEFETIRVDVELHDIDILILTDEGTPNATCWVIENKVKSSQHCNQLDKYVKIVNGDIVKMGRSEHTITDYHNFNKHFCFLTLVGETSKCKEACWKNTTYKNLVDILNGISLSLNNDGVILSEYRQCITNLSDALDDFLNNHQAYEDVFIDGGKKKWDKVNIKGNGCFVKYLSDNGLETIFQKCFLSHINQQTNNWMLYDFGISETHGKALIEYGLKKEKGMSYGIQFQNGAFKVQVLESEAKSKIEIDAFWNHWNRVLNGLCLPVDWKLNHSKGRKVPYFSISKRINGWYKKPVCEIVKDWDNMHDECMCIFNHLIHSYNTLGTY